MDKYKAKARTVCADIFKKHENDHDFTNEQFRAEVEKATENQAVRRLCFWMFPPDCFEIDW